MRNIGYVHLEMPVAFSAAFDVDGIIEVARGFAVDRNDRQAAKIFAACALGIADGRSAPLRLLHDFGGKKVWKMVFADDDFGVDAKLARAA